MQRQGLGKLKHIEIKTLWLQQKVKDKEIYVFKEPTETNLGDLGTKALPEARFTYLLGLHNIKSVPEDLMHLEETKAVSGVHSSSRVKVNAKAVAIAAAALKIAGSITQVEGLTASDESAVCGQSVKEVREWRIPTSALVSLVAVTFLVGIGCGILCMCAWRWFYPTAGLEDEEEPVEEAGPELPLAPPPAPPPQQPPQQPPLQQTTRTMRTQSQTTYDWHLSKPRFRALLRDRDHGAWHD